MAKIVSTKQMSSSILADKSVSEASEKESRPPPSA